MDIRQLVRDEITSRGWTTYRLWRECAGEVSKPSLYGFVSGRKTITAGPLGRILDALGLTITRPANREEHHN